MIYLCVAIGGSVGALARFLINEFIYSRTSMVLPLATLLINILGSLSIGLLFGILNKTSFYQAELRAFLIIGILGGFTTFSGFAFDVVSLLDSKNFLTSFIYIFLSVFGSILAAYIGVLLTNN